MEGQRGDFKEEEDLFLKSLSLKSDFKLKILLKGPESRGHFLLTY